MAVELKLHTTPILVTEAVAVPLPLLTEQTWLAGCVATVTSYGEFGCSVTGKTKDPLLEIDRLSPPLFCRTSVEERPAMLPPIAKVVGGLTVGFTVASWWHPDSTATSPMTGSKSGTRIAKPVKSV